MSKWIVNLVAAAVAGLLAAGAGTAHAASDMDAALAKKAEQAVSAGVKFLQSTQAEDGSWSHSVGITSLALRGYLESPGKHRDADAPFVERGIKFVLGHVSADGAISESDENRNYNTVVAITMLQATGDKRHAKVISDAQAFLKKAQIDEGEGYKPDQDWYGGIGYSDDNRPDLSNQYMALEAMRATAVDPNDPVWQKALVFVNRSQNRSESNDQSWAGNDGGFTYMPGMNPYGGTGSYGGMTHAGLLCLLFAGVDKNDPRVQAAHDWIRAHYTLEENPGVEGKHGLFYYYNAFSKSMYAYGEAVVVDSEGGKHNWRNDLATKLVSLQDADGSWVNKDSSRWWENNKDLVTSWSVIALDQALRR
jgi:squalene-hopene/tetraprenyl-beta-curcumene cyclase